MSRNPKQPQLYSLVILDGSTEQREPVIVSGLSAESVKVQIANASDDANVGVLVFAGPTVKIVNEISLYVDDEPTQQPVKKAGRPKGSKSKSKGADDLLPPKVVKHGDARPGENEKTAKNGTRFDEYMNKEKESNA